MSTPGVACWNCQVRPLERRLYQDGPTHWLCGPCREEIDLMTTIGQHSVHRNDYRDAERYASEVEG